MLKIAAAAKTMPNRGLMLLPEELATGTASTSSERYFFCIRFEKSRFCIFEKFWVVLLNYRENSSFPCRNYLFEMRSK